MPKKVPEHDLISIEREIAAFPNGVGLAALEASLAASGVTIHRRSLQRRLTLLIENGRIAAAGALKGRVYRPIATERAANEERSPIPLSALGSEVRHNVARPIQHREPVGYQREFLLSYPHAGSYLDQATRDHLHRIGRAHQGDLPAGTLARQLLGRLLIDLSWASSHLEGNTYSLLETERLIAFGQAAEEKNTFETQMILNHKQAIEFLVELIAELGFDAYSMLNLHALLSDNLLANPAAGGRIRQIPVGIARSVYTPLATPQLLEEYFQRCLEIATGIDDPFEQSFFALVHLSYLQAFEDVNKRVARLAANIPLIKHNLCPLSFIDVPTQSYVEGLLGVYELNRIELLRDIYVWGYERSVKRYLSQREELGEPDPFRLRYRAALLKVVSAVVRQDSSGLTPSSRLGRMNISPRRTGSALSPSSISSWTVCMRATSPATEFVHPSSPHGARGTQGMAEKQLKPGWRRVKFGDVARLSKTRCADPLAEGGERFVGLEHLEPGDLRIRTWGNVADGVTFTSVFNPGQVLFGKRRAYQRKVEPTRRIGWR